MPLFALRLGFIVLLAAASLQVGAQEDWTERKSEDNFKVYTKPAPGDNITVKTIATAKAAPADLVKILDDVPSYPEWVYHCAEAERLSGGKKDHFYYRSEVSLPFPFKNREVVAEVKQSFVNGVFQRTISARPDYRPDPEGLERARVFEATWKITPRPGGGSDILTIVTTDAGSGLPSWLRNQIVTSGPIKSIGDLIALAEK